MYRKYLANIPRGTVLTARPINGYSNPKRFYARDPRVVTGVGFNMRDPQEAMRLVRDYYHGEGISFAFRYY